MKGVVLLVGCAELSRAVKAEGYRVQVEEYFWGCADPVLPVWRGAIVSTGVGGGTGLSVAERLRDGGIAPVVLYRCGELRRVEGRFLGIEWTRGVVPPELAEVLDASVRRTEALRIEAPTTELRVRTSMIVRVESDG